MRIMYVRLSVDRLVDGVLRIFMFGDLVRTIDMRPHTYGGHDTLLNGSISQVYYFTFVTVTFRSDQVRRTESNSLPDPISGSGLHHSTEILLSDLGSYYRRCFEHKKGEYQKCSNCPYVFYGGCWRKVGLLCSMC